MQEIKHMLSWSSLGLALLTVTLPPSPAVDAVEQRAEDDRYQHAHHYPCCVRAWARPVDRCFPWRCCRRACRVQQPTVMAAYMTHRGRHASPPAEPSSLLPGWSYRASCCVHLLGTIRTNRLTAKEGSEVKTRRSRNKGDENGEWPVEYLFGILFPVLAPAVRARACLLAGCDGNGKKKMVRKTFNLDAPWKTGTRLLFVVLEAHVTFSFRS
jgi:hypothetical protein